MIQLYVNEQLVDVTESVGLFLNKTFENIQNPTTYFCDYSKTISLPMTTTNKKIFSNYQRQDSVVTTESIDPRVRIPFKLLYNSKLVMEGYMKINNANTIVSDNKFECELYSSFGLVMHEIEELTFDKYECQIGGGDKDNKYYIPSPWGNEIEVDRTLVKDSFQKSSHNTYGTDILDYLMFIPTYQGKYPDFQSDKEQILPGRVEDMSRERDEHYVREFRSYYQQPALFVDKLWLLAKDKIEEVTDYQFILDGSWFNTSNPYWNRLIYTCPSLYEKDDNFKEYKTNFNSDKDQYKVNITSMSNLSSHHSKKIYFSPNGTMYNNGTFNQDRRGYTEFNAHTTLQLCAALPNAMYEGRYYKIRKDNPLYCKFYAVNAETNQMIPGASYTYMLYSSSYDDDISSSTYDEKINMGIVHTMSPDVDMYPTGFDGNSGAWWEKTVDVKLTVLQNVPYYIAFDCYWANNSKGVEYAALSWLPRWDWMWTDFFWTTQYHDTLEGYFIFNNLGYASVKTIDYLRSSSKLDLYRIFPKDTTLLDVLLNYSKMFGLMWDVDQDNKKITVMNRNRFFNTYNVKDWTKKIDRNHDFILEPLCFDKKYVAFNVEEGKGGRYETYASKFGGGYGTKKINTEYQFNTETEELFEGIQPSMVCSKRQFSRMYNTEYPDSQITFMGYNYKIDPTEHYVENDDDGSNAGNYGAFYFFNGQMGIDPRLGYISESGYPCVLISDDTKYELQHNEYMWNICGENLTICSNLPNISTVSGPVGGWSGSRYSVHFEAPKEYYFTPPSNIKYIYNLYWKNFIEERYNVQNKKLTCYVYLSPDEYGDINFREFVKIDNTLYHINKIIDYDFDTNSPTKVELVQVWNIEAYTEGQSAFPDLSVAPDEIEINNQEWLPVEVYSTHSWSVQQKPSWVNYTIDNNTNTLNLKANSDPLRSRTGTVIIKSSYQDMTEMITVTQRPLNTYINLNPTSATVSADGDTIEVSIDARPNDITVLSKPSWCSVSIQTRRIVEPFVEYRRELRRDDDVTVETQATTRSGGTQTETREIAGPVNSRFSPIGEKSFANVVPFTWERLRIDRGNTLRINTVTRKVAVITVNQNNGWSSRSGVIRFSNGNVQKNFTIKQLYGSVTPIHFGDEIMEIELNDIGTLDFRSKTEIDPNTISISRGAFTEPMNNVDKITMSISPTLDTVDHGDNTPETTTSGGVVRMVTADGKTIANYYNYGYWQKNYNVGVRGTTGGYFTVDNETYTTSYFESIPDGTSLTITAIPYAGNYFKQWNDGVQTATRTVTVNGADIDIYPEWYEDQYQYDNEDVVDFDQGHNNHILYR